VGRFQFEPVAAGGLSAEELRRAPLAGVDGAAVPGGRLGVELGPRIVGGRYFRLVIDREGQRAPFVTGLSNHGRYPGQNWVEVIELEPPEAIRDDPEWEARLAPYLAPVAAVIPPGGHMMIDYESPQWHSTQLGLLAGIPPIATPMGGVLHRLGLAGSIKDWYFPEGGQEGGRKLQGNRPLSPGHAGEMAARRAEELRAFLRSAGRAEPAVDERARRDAARVLAELEATSGA
jgi:hypothetical protein